MIKRLAPHQNTSIAPVTKALLVLRPWTLPASTTGWKAHRDMIVHYRANPRSAVYMLERAQEFISAHAPATAFDLMVHKDVRQDVSTQDYPWITNLLGEEQLDRLRPGEYHTIVFLYADAIGLGWDPLENSIRRLAPAQFIVINGRRRVFLWDAESRSKLRLRRFLAQAWWLEWLLAPWLLVVSTIYALTDMLFAPSKAR
jgi:hypothetical protein